MAGVTIYGSGHTNILVANNVITGNPGGILVQDGVDGLVITDNTIGPGPGRIEVRGGSGVVVSGNQITTTSYGIGLIDLTAPVNCYGNVITPGRQGIQIVAVNATADDYDVHGNTINEPGTDADNTYSGIYVDGNRNYIRGNRIIPASGANQTEAAVNVVSGDCNIVVGNDLGDPANYGTGALIDAGTDTRLTYPADPTYGDNFTICPTSPSSP